VRKQVPVALVMIPALLIVAAVGYFLLLKPKQDESARLDDEIAEFQTKIDAALAARHKPKQSGVTIRATDLFRLTKAMPDDDDMAGIILQLNAVAGSAGVEFVSISPGPAVPGSGYSSVPISLTFEGNYYDLTDFLFRLRSLVIVRDGELQAEGRLFSLDTFDLHEGPEGFPQIQAALTVSAFVYAPAPPPAANAPATATTTTEGAQALEGTP
jgi:Tfp pilus assembly protein PilO